MGIPVIRFLETKDVEKLKIIHEKYYKEEFDFPDFFRNFSCCFVVEDGKGIITAGGIRNIAELVLVTEKERGARTRHKGLLQALDASCFIAGRSGHDGVHAFVQDDMWEIILKKIGFKDTKGHALVLPF